ncbi:MAG: hypothetical protein ACT4OV_06495 [Microthrixaceae bacterium]
MSDLRILLHDAAPAAPSLDLGSVRRRVSRRRRRRLLGGMFALLAVAGVGLVAAWQRDEATHIVTDDVGGKPSHVGDLAASADGRLFVAGSDDDGNYVAEIDPATGRMTWRVPITGAPPNQIAYGLGRVWILQGGVLSVDPDTHEVAAVLSEPGTSAADIGFTDTYAWVADAGGDRLLRIGPATATSAIELTGMPDQVVVSDDGTVWVRLPDEGTVVGLVLDRPTIAVAATWTGPLLAGSRQGAVWSSDGEQLVEVDPSLLSIGQSVSLGRRVPISGARHVVRLGEGLVVATDEKVWLLSSGDLDLATVDPARALSLGAPSIRSLVVVRDDVWYVDGGGRLVRLPRAAGQAVYEVSPARTARGTRIVVRGSGDPRHGEDLPLELGGREVGRVQVDGLGAFALEVWVISPLSVGTHDVQLGGVVIGTVEVVPAEIGVAYRHPLFTHCGGVVSTNFDGRLWLAEPRPEGSWWEEYDTPGTLALRADGTAEFRADTGEEVRFVQATPGTKDPQAGCEG